MTKPKLTLLSRKNATDMAALVRLFKKLTGREPTAAELLEARAKYGDKIKGM